MSRSTAEWTPILLFSISIICYFVATYYDGSYATIIPKRFSFLTYNCPQYSKSCDGKNFSCKGGFMKAARSCIRPSITDEAFISLVSSVKSFILSKKSMDFKDVVSNFPSESRDDLVSAAEFDGSFEICGDTIADSTIKRPMLFISLSVLSFFAALASFIVFGLPCKDAM